MAALTPDELSGLLQRLRDLTDWWVIAAVEAGGIEALDPVTIQRLVDRGILAPDTQAAIESGDAPDLVGDAFVTGLLFQRLAEEGEDAADWDAKRWHEAIDKRPIALSTEERAILDASRRDVGLYIQGLGNKLADQVGNLVIEVLDEQRREVLLGDQDVRDEALEAIGEAVQEGVARRKGGRWIASRILDATNDGARDLRRIAETEAQNVHERGKAADIAARYGGDARVFKRVSPRCCDACEKAYIDGNGQPRVFLLSELVRNGTNFGRKKADWLPVLDAMHPWCSCSLSVLPEGYGFDDEGNVVRVEFPAREDAPEDAPAEEPAIEARS